MFIEGGFRLAGYGLTAVLALASAAGADIVIDTFETNQGPVVLNLAPGTVGTFQDGAGILQTERNIRVTGSSVAGGAISANVTGGQLTVARPAGSLGEVDLWWDGNNSSTDFNPVGLGGISLTTGGMTGIAIQTVSSTSTSLEMQLVVWTDGGNTSRIFFTLPAGAATIELPFAQFELFSGSGANFTSVGAIYLYTSDNSGAWTFSLTDIRVKRLSTVFVDGFESNAYCLWSSQTGGLPC
jgi:hypothetical protein